MGMYHATYLAYGFQIPDTGGEVLEDALAGQSDGHRVGYLHAGDYDRDMTFLTTECHEVDLGDFKTITPDQFRRYEVTAWNKALHAAAVKLGHADHPEPGWLLVPDLS
jgi:hypothetical protein